MVKVIVFDFDGVLVDSNSIKYSAFFDAFSDAHPDARGVMSSAISENKFGNRFDVFRTTLKRIAADSRHIERLVASYAEDYNKIVQEGIRSMGLAFGAFEIIQSYSEDRGLYINSGTYEPALRETLKNLSIDNFFRGAYGAPATKEENFRKIFQKENAGPQDILFIGDGEQDVSAAAALGLPFVGVANDFNRWKSENVNFPLIKNLPEIKSFL